MAQDKCACGGTFRINRVRDQKICNSCDHTEDIEPEKCDCGGDFQFSRYCGAQVCNDCEQHKGLARCYCGWSASGGDGRSELIEMGETIDEEEG